MYVRKKDKSSANAALKEMTTKSQVSRVNSASLCLVVVVVVVAAAAAAGLNIFNYISITYTKGSNTTSDNFRGSHLI